MKNPSIAEQASMWCKHHISNPKLEEQCEKVDLREVVKLAALGQTGCYLRRPCYRRNHDPEKRNGQPLCPCPHLEWKTPAECEQEEKMWKEHIKKTMLGVAATAQIREEHKGKDWVGVIQCPVCLGKLHIRHSGYNGHVWGKCSTEDCLSWAE